MARTGRPKKEFDKDYFELLCKCQATEADILEEFETTADTLNRWCRENYKDENGKGMNFSKVFKQKRKRGLNSLRATMYRGAMEGEKSLQIFLAKNWLGMSDKVEQKVDVTANDDAAVKEMYEYFKGRSTKPDKE